MLPNLMETEFYVYLDIMSSYHDTDEKTTVPLWLYAINGDWYFQLPTYNLVNAKGEDIRCITSLTKSPKNRDSVIKKIFELRNQSDLEPVEISCYFTYDRKIEIHNLSFSHTFCIQPGSKKLIVHNQPNNDKDTPCFQIERINNKPTLLLKDIENRIYINSVLIAGQTELNTGDVIFIREFEATIIFMGDMLSISVPDPSVLDDSAYSYSPIKTEDPATITEDSRKAVYFQPSPRVYPRPLKEKVSIDAPPAKKEPKTTPAIFTIGSSIVMIMVMAFSVWVRTQASTNSLYAYASMAMIFGSFVGSIFLPMGLKKYQRKRDRIYEETRVKEYGKYINELNEFFIDRHKKTREIYLQQFMDVETAYETAVFHNKSIDDNQMLWNKSPYFQDFLEVRIGIGIRESTIEIEYPAQGFTLVRDPLPELSGHLHNKFFYIIDVPVSVSLLKNYIVGLIGVRAVNITFIQTMLIQLCTGFGYTDVKMFFIYDRNEEQSFGFTRWLPHSWDNNKEKRYIANTPEETAELFSILDQIVKHRSEQDNSEKKVENVNFNSVKEDKMIIVPHYLVFVLSRTLMESSPIGLSLLDLDEYRGVSFIYLEEGYTYLPKKTTIIIQNTSKESSYFTNSDKTSQMRMFKKDLHPGYDLKKMAASLFRTRIRDISVTSAIPDNLTFLNMYNAKTIMELNIEARWAANKASEKIEAFIGMDASEKIFALNIHEKGEGPHGLIAGMTGSGKSEFIQSMILSLAINYSPYEIALVLIDYKGGGMAEQFRKLPHLAGIITNLEGNEIERSLNTLISEVERRQKIFKEYQVNSIDMYSDKFHKGEAESPIPHLLIIADEFAELKKSQPSFMKELVSIARIGRSLGVHLILATQNPGGGMVDEDIWSNSKFRICLKVLSKSDSNDVLKRSEAADIRQPGRAYIQVGNNEVFKLIQSGYSGAPYKENTEEDAEEDGLKKIFFLDGLGRKSVVDIGSSSDKKYPTQLSVIISALREAAHDKYHQEKLWQPILKAGIFLDEDAVCAGRSDVLNPVIGRLDDTGNQAQPYLTMPFLDKGHAIIYGLPGSGKATLLQTLATSLARSYTPEQVNIYIMDFASHNMRYLSALPHVGDVVFEEENIKTNKLFSIMLNTIQQRRLMFSEVNISNYKGYIQKKRKVTLPAIILIIHDYAVFKDVYSDYIDTLAKIAAGGAMYGIYLVITAKTSGVVNPKISSAVTQVYALRLKDRAEYISVIGYHNIIMPNSDPGRGIVRLERVMEFQIFLAEEGENDTERLDRLSTEYAEISAGWTGEAAQRIPVVPDPYLNTLEISSHEYKLADKAGQLPIGYDIQAVKVITLPAARISVFPVIGFAETGKTNFIRCMIETVLSFDWKVMVFDNYSHMHSNVSRKTNYGQTPEEYHELVEKLAQEVELRKRDRVDYLKRARPPAGRIPGILIAIDDFNDFIDIIDNDDCILLEHLIPDFYRVNICMVTTLNPEKLSSNIKNYPVYRSVFQSVNLLFLGGNYDHMVTTFTMLPKTDRKLQMDSYKAGEGLLYYEQSVIKVITPEFG